MEKFKGTKGDWRLHIPSDSNGYVHIINSQRSPIATCYTADDSEDKDYPTTGILANAQLIAAAPKLLKMLRELVDIYDSLPDGANVSPFKNGDFIKAKGLINSVIIVTPYYTDLEQ